MSVTLDVGRVSQTAWAKDLESSAGCVRQIFESMELQTLLIILHLKWVGDLPPFSILMPLHIFYLSVYRVNQFLYGLPLPQDTCFLICGPDP